MSTNTTERASSMKISLKRGIECFFDIGDHTIRVWASAWTGREVVELDSKIVSSRYSFKTATPHRFNHDGHDYEVVFKIHLVSSLFQVFLYRDGELLDSDQGRHASIPINPDTGNVDWRRYGWQIALYTLAGGLTGGVIGYTVASLTKGVGS